MLLGVGVKETKKLRPGSGSQGLEIGNNQALFPRSSLEAALS